ncbi:MAG: helix-turn-helix domain-containing protein [Coriobacteriaceae bacterium]|nr:MAG: helix-turn-helix domain-containing protein [Coriobacteriaceae bacterium]
MDGYSHLSIAKREDIMVCWKGHEGGQPDTRELGRDKSTISHKIRRNGWQGPSGRPLPGIERAKAYRRKAAVLQASQISWTIRIGALWSCSSC